MEKPEAKPTKHRETLENTRVIEAERAQNDALQKYFELMGQLLTKEKLRSPVDDADDVRILAQAQTLTALKSLGPDRKLILLNFLHKAKLIEKENPIVSLDMAHLGAADLSEASLIKANLSGAYLREANLSDAD